MNHLLIAIMTLSFVGDALADLGPCGLPSPPASLSAWANPALSWLTTSARSNPAFENCCCLWPYCPCPCLPSDPPPPPGIGLSFPGEICCCCPGMYWPTPRSWSFLCLSCSACACSSARYCLLFAMAWSLSSAGRRFGRTPPPPRRAIPPAFACPSIPGRVPLVMSFLGRKKQRAKLSGEATRLVRKL